MKNVCSYIVIACLLVACSSSYRVNSPDGELSVTFDLTDEGQPTYCVQSGTNRIIASSQLGLIAEEVALDKDFKVLAVEHSSCDEKWETVWGEERWICDKHNEMLIKLEHPSGKRMDIAFRVFDDGFAFRYIFPEQEQQSLTITDEDARVADVPLSMLDEGVSYRLTLWFDADDADWQTNPYAYEIKEYLVTAADTLHLRMAAGGGFAAIVSRVED